MANSSTTQFGDDCVLMLHMDGSDLSTTFTDSSTAANTVTANGGATLVTAVQKFGSASGVFVSAASSYLTVPNSSNWNFGTGDFTIDFWVRFNTHLANATLISYNNGDDFWVKWITGSGGIMLFYAGGAGVETAFTPTDNQWYHIAMTRSGTSLNGFIDGVVGTTATSSFNITDAGTLNIGASNAPSNYSDVWIDELRVVKGTAVWTANFTPSTSAYTSSVGNPGAFFLLIN